MDTPRDETNHIDYNCWKDKGGNIGVQCALCDTTHWDEKTPNGKILIDPEKPELGLKECGNCQAIKVGGVLNIENKRHKEQCVEDSEHPDEMCHHKPSQP